MKGKFCVVMAAAGILSLLLAGTAPAPPPVPRPSFRPPPRMTPMPRPMPHPSFEPAHIPSFRGGRLPTPRFSRVEVLPEVRSFVKTEPVKAIEILGGDRGSVLSPQERITLTRQAVNQLAIEVETPGNALKALPEVRNVAKAAEGIDLVAKARLESIEFVARTLLVREGVGEVRGLVERGKWGEAGDRAGELLRHLDNPQPGGASKTPNGPARAEVPEARGARGALTEVTEVGKQTRTLDNLGEALKTGDRLQSAEMTAALQKVNGENLPRNLRDLVKGMQGLEQLRAEAVASGERPPNVAAVQKSVAAFERGIATLPEAKADPTLPKRLQQDLAVKAFLEGHSSEARQLLPRDGPAEHAADLLRDMKAMMSGEGEVVTCPAQQALAPKPGEGGGTPRGPPPGMRPLIPEGAREGWRPRVRESARADLPPIEKAVELGEVLQSRAAAELKAERTSLGERATKSQQRLQGIDLHIRQNEAEEKRRFTAMEAKLGRKLEPDERVHVCHLAAQNKTNDEIVANLRGQTATLLGAEFRDLLFAARTIGLLGSSHGQGPLLAASTSILGKDQSSDVEGSEEEDPEGAFRRPKRWQSRQHR
jgi:hypothetical protein